jgi:hypothetical protein
VSGVARVFPVWSLVLRGDDHGRTRVSLPPGASSIAGCSGVAGGSGIARCSGVAGRAGAPSGASIARRARSACRTRGSGDGDGNGNGNDGSGRGGRVGGRGRRIVTGAQRERSGRKGRCCQSLHGRVSFICPQCRRHAHSMACYLARRSRRPTAATSQPTSSQQNRCRGLGFQDRLANLLATDACCAIFEIGIGAIPRRLIQAPRARVGWIAVPDVRHVRFRLDYRSARRRPHRRRVIRRFLRDHGDPFASR